MAYSSATKTTAERRSGRRTKVKQAVGDEDDLCLCVGDLLGWVRDVPIIVRVSK